jgi:hypothetical protein
MSFSLHPGASEMSDSEKSHGGFLDCRQSRREMLSASLAGLGLLAIDGCNSKKVEKEPVIPQPIVVRPKEFEGVLNNPWMGWGIWGGPIYFDGTRRTVEENTKGFGDNAPLFDWILLDWMWADLEPQESDFHWDELDQIIGYWAERGKQICLRPWVTDDPGWNGAPGAEKVCPDWVYDAGLRWHEYTGEGGSKKREPDYADPSFGKIFMPRLKNFLEALADHYDMPGNPFAFIGCMGYGQWGEWHTMWSNYYWPSKKVKHDILGDIVNLYADTFKYIDLAISYCFDSFNIGSRQLSVRRRKMTFREMISNDDIEDFKYRQAVDVALQRGFLLTRHGFIDGLGYTDKRIMEEEWRNTGMMAEGDWSYMDMKDHGTHGTVDENIDIMLEWHSNYAHFYVDAPSYRRLMQEDSERFARGLRSGGLGYRLVLKKASFANALAPGQLFVIKQGWENRNVGRCYRRHPLKLYLTDKTGNEVFSEVDYTFDQTQWVQGRTYELYSVYHLPADLDEGVYDVRLAMTDEMGNPALLLGIEGEDDRRRYVLGKLRIDKNASYG